MIGRVDRFRHDAHVVGEVIGTFGRLLDIPGNRFGRGGLLFNGAGDCRGYQINIIHHFSDRADRADRVVGQILN